jgi:hypothetical protein
MAEQTEVGKLPSVIPELYYDLIARVIPGAVLLLLGTLPITIHLPIDSLKEMSAGSATLLLVVFLLASYWAGILITPLGSLFHELYRYRVFREALREEEHKGEIRRFGGALGLNDLSSESSNQDLNTVDRVMHEFLKDRGDQARLILPKMKAEVTLCDNSLVAMLGAGILVLAFDILQRLKADPLVIELLPIVVGVLLSFLAAGYRMKRLLVRQRVLMTLVPESELLALASKRGTSKIPGAPVPEVNEPNKPNAP